jgi:hypothetical protein
MDITREYLTQCRTRFEELRNAEQSLYRTYWGILAGPPVSAGWHTFFKKHPDCRYPPSDSVWIETLEKWAGKAAAIRRPQNDFESRCLVLAAYRVGKMMFHRHTHPVHVNLLSNIVRVYEELFLMRPFPENLVWSSELALSFSLLLLSYDLPELYVPSQYEKFRIITLTPDQMTEALATTKSEELMEEHPTLKPLRSGKWNILTAGRFLGEAFGVDLVPTTSDEEDSYSVLGLLKVLLNIHAERSVGLCSHVLVSSCVRGHCLLVGSQEVLRTIEAPDEQDAGAMNLIGHVAHKNTQPFRRALDFIGRLPSNRETEPLKREHAPDGTLNWDTFRHACLSYIEGVERLMAGAMGEDKQAAVEALLAIKRAAQVLVKLDVDRDPKRDT